jgi:RNA polymerase sigma-70 factor (ECF subfamily)
MDPEHVAPQTPASVDPRFEAVWRQDRPRMLGFARRTLGDAGEAEDVVQEAFGRLARVDLDELDDVHGWLAVVVRRLCLDRIR